MTKPRRSVFLPLIVAAIVFSSGAGTSVVATEKHSGTASIVRAPIAFEANVGQYDPHVQFASRGSGYALFLTDNGAVVSMRDRSTMRIAFDGATARAPIELERLPGVVNYLIGNDPARWHTGVPLYSRVRYDAIYPGVDLVYYGHDARHEYDLVVAPNADPSRIALRVTGADRVERDATGGLQLIAAGDTVTMRMPTAYQVVDGERQPIEARYAIDGTRVAFELGDYDASAPLVIDPQLVYGTFLGGTGNGVDQATGVAVDAAGNAYIVGTTETTDFPTAAPLQRQRLGQSDAFVTKLSPEGQLVYSTYLGGTSYDYGADIDVRDDGTTYVLGDTSSQDFPVPAAVTRRYSGNSDSFVVELNASGGSILHGAFIGGSATETAGGLVLGSRSEPAAAGNLLADGLFVYGSTQSPDFPTPKSERTTRRGTSDAWVTVFDRQSFQPVFASYAGLDDDERPTKLILDRARGGFYLAETVVNGSANPGLRVSRFDPRATTGANGSLALIDDLRWILDELVGLHRLGWHFHPPTPPDPPMPPEDPEDAGLKTAIGVETQSPTSLGGSAGPPAIEQLRSRFAAVRSGCIPVAPAATCNERAALMFWDEQLKFIGHLNFGGPARGREFIVTGSVVGGDGRLHFIGTTSDNGLPVQNPVQANYGGSAEGFVLTLDPVSGETSFFSYLGGVSFDTLADIAIDKQGNLWIVGDTQSADFPSTRSGAQPELRGRMDSFVVKISP